MKMLTSILALLVFGSLSLVAQSDEYTYDKHGRVTKVRYANGQEVRYEYDGYNNLTSIRSVVASVPESEQIPDISVRPNPASDHVTIEVPAPAGTAVTFRVVTLDGRQILRRQVLADGTGTARTTLERDQDGLSTGQYQVAVATTTGRFERGHIGHVQRVIPSLGSEPQPPAASRWRGLSLFRHVVGFLHVGHRLLDQLFEDLDVNIVDAPAC